MRRSVIVCLLAITALTPVGMAASDGERIAELERKVDALSRESERASYGDLFLPVGKGRYGLGPAASKIYDQTSGVTIGGYGEAIYENKEDGTDTADFLRAIIYLGHRFSDQWLLNTEIEFEHASTDKEGSASVEFAYLDYLHSEAFNFRAGLLLVPVGIVNELHEPTLFLSAKRTEVESKIIPTTWRENGVGFFGQFSDALSYKAYVVNGLRGENFSASGLRGGRQKGSEALADDFAGILRLDLAVSENLDIGGSLYHGGSGQDLGVTVDTTIVEGHALARMGALQLRALATMAELDDVASLNRILATDPETGVAPADGDIESIGEELFGWYLEAGLDVFTSDDGECTVTPFVRYEELDTQDRTPAGFKNSGTYDQEIITFGVAVRPAEQIVFKLDHQVTDNAAGSARDQSNVAMGYIF